VKWSQSQNVARIDANRIIGVNIGEATIEGRWRNKQIEIKVKVIEPMDQKVGIARIYGPDHAVGPFGEGRFVSPSSIAIAKDGTVYVADSGALRKISGGVFETINIEAKIVRCYQNDAYALTAARKESDGRYRYAIARLSDGGAEEIYAADAIYTEIEDFGFFPQGGGKLYFIERSAGMGEVYLKTINLEDPEDIYTEHRLPPGAKSLAFGDDGEIYLSNPETGTIQRYKNGELKYFAGTEGEKALVDGAAPLFYMPQRIKCAGGALYVLDFGALRKISADGEAAPYCVTLAEAAAAPESFLADFAVTDEAILVTDPGRGAVWIIN
jgi:hypothetical protein